ncbi:MAG: glycosyltransferase family 39 protein [Bryobacteraceae bacterium]
MHAGKAKVAAASGRASKPSRGAGKTGYGSALQPVGIVALFASLSAVACAYFYSRGSLLYYGDAVAHLNIARRILDSRTPGWEQIGTVWLPLPHLLLLPFVRNMRLWTTGLAGAIPSGFCFVLGGLFFFLAVRRIFQSAVAATAACLLLALNPNLLYLQSLAMTEPVYLAAIAAVLYFSVRFRQEQSPASAIAAGLAACAGTLTRYEGWFLIPFVALYFFLAARQRRWLNAILFGAIASLGPLWWLAHNWWYFGDPLEFYRGASSAQAIYRRALDAGMGRYAGDNDWKMAFFYFRSAAAVCAGAPLAWMAVAGAVAALFKRALWPLVLLSLAPVFYVMSIHSSGTPIFMPHLWPHSWYNTRYGLAALPLLAFAAAALVALAPVKLRALVAAAVVIAAVSPWLVYPSAENWICWKESQVNSEVRRAWTTQAAAFLEANRHPGDGVIASFGDLTGIFQDAGIPLRATLHEGNHPLWLAAVSRPGLFLWEKWAVAVSGDPVSSAIDRVRKSGPRYDLVKTIAVKGAPVIEIYRRAR